MPTVHCCYSSTVQTAIGKREEHLTLPDGATVEDVLQELVGGAEQALSAICIRKGGSTAGITKRRLSTSKRIQWPQDFPLGIKMPLKHGDVLSFGLVMSGGGGTLEIFF